MPDVYSPLRYPGGKAKLSSFLIEAIKASGLRQPFYIEPYAGGAGAALRLLFEEFVQEITINDADPRIRSFWDAVTKKTDRFISRLQEVPLSVDEWKKQKQIYQDRDLRRIFDLGFATFYLNRTTRSGIIHNGGPIGGFDQSGNYRIDARFNRVELARRIIRIGAYAERITVSGDDGLSLLKKLNRRRFASETFVYIDPPYYVKGNGLYLNKFTHIEHSKLAKYLSSRKRFAWLMTYDDVAQVRDLYSELAKIPFSLLYSAHFRKSGSELLIHPPNFELTRKIRSFLPEVCERIA